MNMNNVNNVNSAINGLAANVRNDVSTWLANDGGLTAAACDAIRMAIAVEQQLVNAISNHAVDELADMCDRYWDYGISASTGTESDMWHNASIAASDARKAIVESYAPKSVRGNMLALALALGLGGAVC